MSQEIIIANTNVSFKDFLFKNKRNRTILLLSAAVIAIQFSVFKYFYPFASYIHGDSFSYLEAAEKNLSINTYLIGYSKFLRLFSVFNRTDYTLTAFQYLFIQCSALYLLFTLFYFYKSGKVVQGIMLCFMVFNPLFLHLGNLVSSDGIFLALSLTWFSLLLWIIHNPSNKIIIWHAVILFIAFIFRYNAMIYPLIAVLGFWLSKFPLRNKIAGLSLVFLLCGVFVGFTMYQYKKLTGFWQYSPFSGWQFANNAMYAYRYVDSANRKPVPKKLLALDKMIREHFDSTRDVKKHPTEAIMASTFYMWTRRLPLYTYRDNFFKKDSTISEFKKWSTMGPFYKSYGLYIIKQYPMHFIQYFVWPNANKYYAPPVEFLADYNSGSDVVTNQAKNWFGYKSQKIKTRMKDNKVQVLNYYPILSGIINMVMLCSLLCYTILNGWHSTNMLRKGIFLGSMVWLLNAGFTILASSAALRFQSFPIILTTIFTMLLLDWMLGLIANKKQFVSTPISKDGISDPLQQAVV